jgi:centromeric protein E
VDDGDQVCLAGQVSAPKYAFDSVHRDGSTNQDIYKSVGAPVVRNAVDGYNGTLFAYGVTSSGKTHTMMGHSGEPGLVPLALQHLFRLIQETRERFFLVKFSMLEIYNETINDLIDPTSTNLRLREDSRRDLVFVEGVKNVEVRCRGF